MRHRRFLIWPHVRSNVFRVWLWYGARLWTCGPSHVHPLQHRSAQRGHDEVQEMWALGAQCIRKQIEGCTNSFPGTRLRTPCPDVRISICCYHVSRFSCALYQKSPSACRPLHRILSTLMGVLPAHWFVDFTRCAPSMEASKSMVQACLSDVTSAA